MWTNWFPLLGERVSFVLFPLHDCFSPHFELQLFLPLLSQLVLWNHRILFTLIQLISSVVFLSCNIFQLDVVTICPRNYTWIGVTVFSWELLICWIHPKIFHSHSLIISRFFRFVTIWYSFLCSHFQQFRDFNYSIVIQFIAIAVGCSNVYVYCNFGKIATQSYANMSRYLFESNWIEQPIEFQKYFILMIGNTQRALHYHGFGISVLNLETFSTVSGKLFFRLMDIDSHGSNLRAG